MDIYIKPAEKVQLVGKREVLLRDVAEVFLSGQTAGEAERLVVFRIPEERKKTYLLSVVDLIQVLHRKYPNAAVNNVGETDILIEYLPQAEGRNLLWVWTKVAFVSLVLFVGASTTIMCFRSHYRGQFLYIVHSPHSNAPFQPYPWPRHTQVNQNQWQYLHRYAIPLPR